MFEGTPGKEGRAMDRTEEVCLASLLDESMPAFPALHILVQLAHSLESEARAGILHGDIQPWNISVSFQGVPRLLAFGAFALTTGAVVPGSEGYSAPERLGGGIASAQTDLFSFAATAFHILTGRPPFVAATPEEVVHAVRKGELRLPPKMSTVMQKVFLKALERDPECRFSSYGHFMSVLIASAPLAENRLEDLLSFLDGKPIPFEGLDISIPAQMTAPRPPTAIRSTQSIPVIATRPEGPQDAERLAESLLSNAPGVIGFAVFRGGEAQPTCSPQSGELADLAPAVYFQLADSVFGEAGNAKVRYFLFRTKQGIRYLLHRRLDVLIVVKLKSGANHQELLHRLDDNLNLNAT